MSEKEKYWAELNICSDLREKIISIRLDEEELDSSHRKLEFISRRKAWADLYKNKTPIFLRDMLGQIIQELEIESNQKWIDLCLDDEVDRLIEEVLSKEKIKPKREKNFGGAASNKLSADDLAFFRDLKRKAESSYLDTAILANENNLKNLVYLFEGPTILKNPIFFRLFQHWFESSAMSNKIDELVYQLKNRAGIVTRGPASYTKKEKIRIVFRYEYLRRIFVKSRPIVKELYSNEEARKEWRKYRIFLRKHRYFEVKKDLLKLWEISKGYDSWESIGGGWLINNFDLFKQLPRYGMPEQEFRQEMRKRAGLDAQSPMKEKDIKKILNETMFLEILDTIRTAEPSELALFLVSKIFNSSKRQIRRVIDSNNTIVEHVSKIIDRIPGLA
ncbi:MAG: hypothetical protein ABSF88_00355 [Candidatus Aminicenantales bacterium]